MDIFRVPNIKGSALLLQHQYAYPTSIPPIKNQELHPENRLEACEGARERRARGRLGQGGTRTSEEGPKRNCFKKW